MAPGKNAHQKSSMKIFVGKPRHVFENVTEVDMPGKVPSKLCHESRDVQQEH